MGLISIAELTTFFEENFKVSSKDFIKAWNSILLDFPKKRLDFLKDIFQNREYRLFLLSNTNHLHICWIQESWGAELYNEFKGYFEQFYLSQEINFRKPNKDIYEFVLKENNLVAEETLFIDDTKINTDAAQKLGIHVWNLIPGEEDVTELFDKKSNIL